MRRPIWFEPAFLVHVLIEPAHKEPGNARAVFFRHHLVSVAGQSDGLEPYEGSLNTCLIEPLGYAMGVGAMIARLSGYVEHRYSLDVTQLIRRLLLNPPQ